MLKTDGHVLLRVYLQSADRSPRTPTYELLVKAAREMGLAGATVLKGLMGFGTGGEIRRSGAFSLVEHVPIVVEVVDRPEAIERFIDGKLPELMRHGIATLERATVMTQSRSTDEIQLRSDMTSENDGVLLRIFIGESDRSADGKPLYEFIVQKAREAGLAGATVFRGIEGFGANSVVHKAKLLEMSSDLPIVIEIVDRSPKIDPFVTQLQSVVADGMITLERVRILSYRHNPADAPGHHS